MGNEKPNKIKLDSFWTLLAIAVVAAVSAGAIVYASHENSLLEDISSAAASRPQQADAARAANGGGSVTQSR